MKTIPEIALVALSGVALGSAITFTALKNPIVVGFLKLDVLTARMSAADDHRLVQECTNLSDNAWCDEVLAEVHGHLESRLRDYRVGDGDVCGDAERAISFGGFRVPVLSGLWQVRCNAGGPMPWERQ